MDQPPIPDFDLEATQPIWKRRSARVVLGLVLLIAAVMIWTTQPLFWVAKANSVEFVDPKGLAEDVQTLVMRFPQREPRHASSLDAAAAWIEERMKASGARVERQEYTVKGVRFVNVIGRYGPETGARVVVGAHYDACDGLPGADDNASGVAGLLALARALGGRAPQTPVELVAYTLEEPPHFRFPSMGSAVHAKSLSAAHVAVKAMVCLEMLGTYEDRPNSQDYPVPGLGLIYPSRGNFIAVVGDLTSPFLVRKVKGAMASASSVPVWSINAPAVIPGVDFSDHRSYWAEGFPAVMVTDSAFFRNPRYHTNRDTPDRLDYVQMARVLEGVNAAIRQLAQ
jgi:hypothetical protein